MTNPNPPSPIPPGQASGAPTSEPFLDEVQALKHDASARCGHDLNRILEETRLIEARPGASVRPAPSPVLKPGNVA